MAIKQEKANKIINFINGYYIENMYSPSLREIENGTGINRTTCGKILKALAEEGKGVYYVNGKYLTNEIYGISETRPINTGRKVLKKIFAAESYSDGSKKYVEIGSIEIDEDMSLKPSEDIFILSRYKGKDRDAEGGLVLMEMSEKAARKKYI